jgi:hypothetical protein
MMNNKGDVGIIMMLVFEALFVIVIIAMLTSGATRLGESASLKKINAAEEIRLIANALLAVPGEGVVEYPRGKGLVLSLTAGEVQAYTEGENEALWIKRTIVLPEGYTAFGTVKGSSSVCVEKQKTQLSLRICKAQETAAFGTFKIMLSSKKGEVYSYDAGESATPLYFRYLSGKWEWSPDEINWMPTNTTFVAGGKWDGQQPVKSNIAFIDFLENYNPAPALVEVGSP